MELYPFSGEVVMLSKPKLRADEARAPRAMWGYFSRNHAASTVKEKHYELSNGLVLSRSM